MIGGSIPSSTATRPTAEPLEPRLMWSAAPSGDPSLRPGDLLVADFQRFNGGTGALFRIDPPTGAQSVVSAGGKFLDPLGVTVERGGGVLVLDGSNFGSAVFRVDPATGTQETVSAGGSLKRPGGIAVAAGGDILVADAGWAPDQKPPGVIRIDPISGNQSAVSFGGLFFYPMGVAAEAGGTILVTDIGDNAGDAPADGKIIRVDPATGRQQLLASGEFLRDPRAIALEADGQILVSDAKLTGGGGVEGRVIRVDPATGAQSLVSAGGDLVALHGLAVEADGGIIVTAYTNIHTPRVLRVDPADGSQQVLSFGGDLTNPLGVAVVPPAEDGAAVVGRHVFYNHSAWDGNDPGADARDDAAIAADKAALLPGQTATFRNYTSYPKGINGVMVDVRGLASAALTADDFAFAVGNDDSAADWPAGPQPRAVSVRRGGGVGGSDRVTLVWEDYQPASAGPLPQAAAKQWLRVTVRANARTGLADDDEFYFGNAIGESGNWATAALVNRVDELGARHRFRAAGNPAPVDFRWDYNRDKRVNQADVLIARVNRTTPETALRLIGAPPPPAAASAAVPVCFIQSISLGDVHVAPRRLIDEVADGGLVTP